MSPVKPSGKLSDKATRQMLFSEAVLQPRPMSSSAFPPDPNSMDGTVNPDTAMERILHKISTVGRHLEAMDSKITDLSADSKSIRADFAGFRPKSRIWIIACTLSKVR
ncbi:hypothetical protein NDU88_007831 [Pleurodeles waltl]|uniref:Uncharacterized protein n=1 Tax=Pleurodeles waltl TaxID=8319 RepID=A0AAV7NCJ0_PLEWA|nr:hypothetical protein NDU88_007831 [Pleurodeles waltl]